MNKLHIMPLDVSVALYAEAKRDAALRLATLAVQLYRAKEKLDDVRLSRHEYIAACEKYDALEDEYDTALQAYAPYVKE